MPTTASGVGLSCRSDHQEDNCTWWHHQIETFSALLALCEGNSRDTGEFPSRRPVMWSFDVFFDLGLNKRLSKQSWGWLIETHRAHYGVTVMNCSCLPYQITEYNFLRLNYTNTRWKQTKIAYCGSFPTQLWVSYDLFTDFITGEATVWNFCRGNLWQPVEFKIEFTEKTTSIIQLLKF